jgi:hypothetical protein
MEIENPGYLSDFQNYQWEVNANTEKEEMKRKRDKKEALKARKL